MAPPQSDAPTAHFTLTTFEILRVKSPGKPRLLNLQPLLPPSETGSLLGQQSDSHF